MANRTRNTIQLGLFVTIGVALFILSVYFIGSHKQMFRPALRVSAVFHNIGGLQPGNIVRYSGINAGTVENIEILNDSMVKVNMKLGLELKPFIKKDAIASIGSDGLVGSMLVNISPGKGGEKPVEEGDVLPSYSRIKTDELLNTLGKTNENIELITNDLLLITRQMTQGKGTVAMLLRDTLLATGLKESVEGLKAASGHIAATGRRLERLAAQVESGDGLLGQLLYDTTVIDNLNTSIAQADTIAAQMEPILFSLQQAAVDISASSATLKAALEGLQAGEGPAGTLLKDSTAAANLQQALENLHQGSARFNENMEALQHNFLFRRYFRKKAKAKEDP
ncbi:MAG: MCE family protein [Phaeodactylibacter sp.]|nr:MCE family protein [Phaeodactylibacter sp.]